LIKEFIIDDIEEDIKTVEINSLREEIYFAGE
jgi:hypothetical protein